MEKTENQKTLRPPFSFLLRDLLKCEDKKKACIYTILGMVIVLLIGGGLLSLRDDLDRIVNILAPLFMGLVTITGLVNLAVLLFVRSKRWPSLLMGFLSLLSLNITGGIYTLAIGKSEIIRPAYTDREVPMDMSASTSLFVEERPTYQEGYDKENNVVVRVVSKKAKTKPYQVRGIEDVSAKNNWKGWLYLAPVIILVSVFLIYPLVSTIFISFTSSYNYQTGSFDGLTFRNFTFILGLTTKSPINDAREVFFTKYAIPNTFILVIVTVPISTMLALIIAVALNSIKWFQKALQTIFFLPYVTNGIAVGMVFSVMFDQSGVINYIFGTNIAWISATAQRATAFIPLVIYIVWNSIPFKILIFLSGLQGIDKQYYHAAQIDSAPRHKVLWRITVPLLSPQILYILITSFIGAFKEYTSIVGLFNGPGTAGKSDPNMETIVYYIYDNISEPSIASAAAVFLFVIILAFTALQFAASKKRVHY
ncbi:MAG: sugar ABC transporter permease [Bacilli bacterium]|nr:sugar ABC transporter permease [Bacilli bacterium]